LMDDSSPLCWDVLTGRSSSRRDQPSELIESRKELDAIAFGKFAAVDLNAGSDAVPRILYVCLQEDQKLRTR
jgi:hypothetical protein